MVNSSAFALVSVATSLFGSSLVLADPGDLDPGFGDVGRVGPIASVPGTAWSMFSIEDGSLVIGGAEVLLSCPPDIIGCVPPKYVGFAARSFLIRVSVVGELVESHEIPASGFHLLAIARQTDGKVVAAGRRLHEKNLHSEFVVYRLNQDGSLDKGFGDNGLVQLPAAERSNVDQATAIVVEPDDRIVVAGSTVRSGYRSEILIRLLPNGDIDQTFGSSGVVVLPGRFSTAAVRIPLNLTQLVRTERGDYRVSDSGWCQIVGLTPDGTFDPAFGSSGTVQIDHPISVGCWLMMAMQADGRLVVGASDGEAAVVTQILADGQPDPSFLVGTGIKDSVGYIIHALAVGSDGSIFVALGLSDFGYHGLEVKQLLPSGELNESFGNAGSVEIDQIASDYNGWLLFDLLVRENGAVVGAGGTFATSQGPIIVQLLGAGMGDGPGVLSTQGLSVDEQDVSVDVRRTGGNAGHVSVAYQVLAYDGENSATIGEDFVADAARLEWKDGDATTQQIRVRIIDDDLAEDDELLTVLLTDARGGAGLGQAGAVIKVRANDGFSAGPGQLAFRGALDLLQVEEDDLDEDVTFNVPVERMSGSAGAVSVSYATTDGTATAGTDYLAASDTLSWADGESGVKSISIQTLHDSAAEGDEDFQIRLSNATGGATIHMLGGFQNVRILDNDTAIGFNPQTVSVSEQDTSVEVTIERIDPQGGEASVDYSTSGDSAAADSDFTSTSGTLTWAAGDPNEKTVEIPISDDSQDEPDETFTVSLANPSGGLSLGANSVATVTIVDNDAPSGSGGGGGGALDWLEILGLAALAWLGRGSHIGCRSGANAALGPVNDRPVRVADSTGRCNMFGKFLCR